MKMRFWIMVLAAFLALGAVAAATTYYIDDNSNTGDVYTPGFTGNDVNNGLSPTTPKLTLNNLLASTNLLPGDIVFIDTGTYATNVVIGTNVVGAAGNRIVFQGSTNQAAGGTVLTGSGTILLVRGRYLRFADITAFGGAEGVTLDLAQNCEFERVFSISNGSYAIQLQSLAYTNIFRRCIAQANTAAIRTFNTARGNYFENSIIWARAGVSMRIDLLSVSNVVDCIIMGPQAFISSLYVPDSGSRNLFWGMNSFGNDMETLADLQQINTNWYGNTVADPKFANAAAFDFHLLSAAGYVSNGVWVTNAAVGYSPGIDFGARE